MLQKSTYCTKMFMVCYYVGKKNTDCKMVYIDHIKKYKCLEKDMKDTYSGVNVNFIWVNQITCVHLFSQ